MHLLVFIANTKWFQAFEIAWEVNNAHRLAEWSIYQGVVTYYVIRKHIKGYILIYSGGRLNGLDKNRVIMYLLSFLN